MMAAGYGGEGDWKTSGMLRVLKVMATGLKGGKSLMEDYAYHFNPTNSMVLGSHMLEICPSIAAAKVQCLVHPLGIGRKEDPIRLIFKAAAGKALNVFLIDLGNRFRLLANQVEAVEVKEKFSKLPTARVMCKPKPTMEIGLHAWFLAGGAHHTVFSQNLSTDYMEDFAYIFGIELVIIDENTSIRQLKNELRFNSVAYK